MNAAQLLTVFAYLAAAVSVWIVLSDYRRER
jgi:hypothetical protein